MSDNPSTNLPRPFLIGLGLLAALFLLALGIGVGVGVGINFQPTMISVMPDRYPGEVVVVPSEKEPPAKKTTVPMKSLFVDDPDPFFTVDPERVFDKLPISTNP